MKSSHHGNKLIYYKLIYYNLQNTYSTSDYRDVTLIISHNK